MCICYMFLSVITSDICITNENVQLENDLAHGNVKKSRLRQSLLFSCTVMESKSVNFIFKYNYY